MGGYATNPDNNAASEITGSGTANYMAKFTAAQVIGNSTVQDDGTTVSTVSKMSVGNYATPTALRQLTVGQDTAFMSMGSVVGATSYSAIYFNQATPSGTNYTLAGDANSTFLNANTTLYLRIGASNMISVTSASQVYTHSGVSSGASVSFTFTGVANTGQTASTEINRMLITTGSRQWATGAITTQREVYITSPTYSFVGASTITSAYTLYVEAPTASTNATISSSYALGLSGNLAFVGGNRSIIGSNAVTVQSSSGSNVVLNAGSTGASGINIAGQGTQRLFLVTATDTTGAVSYLTYSPSSNTGQTASTEVNGFLYNSYTRTWAAGAITTQREQYIKTVTYAFASASTVTNAYGLYVEAPTAGSNATITNNWAAGFQGSIKVLSVSTNKYIELEGTAGQKARMSADGSGAFFGSATNVATRFIVNNGVFNPIWLQTTGNVNIENKMYVGASATTPTAVLHLLAGTATANTAPLKFTSGTNLTTAEAGAMEYNGTNLFFTRSGTTRESVICANAVNVVSPTAQNRTITVVIDGTTYYLTAKTTND